MALRIIIFLIINFTGLALGAFFTDTGIDGSWYATVNKAPWTPPGWVFGAAWTTIMICFAIYMAYAYKSATNRSLLLSLFGLQWLLNFGWNPIFFQLQEVLLGLIIISALTILIGYLLLDGYRENKEKSLLVAPYFIWLTIATSLNSYIYFQN